MTDVPDAEYRAEFERQQFLLYEARRLASETHANAVFAAALAIAAVLVADYGRTDHPALLWFLLGVAGVAWVLVFSNIARIVNFLTPRWRGGGSWGDERPSDVVGRTLTAMREGELGGVALRDSAHEHWRARALSAWHLGLLKGRRLGLSLWGLLGPVVYFAARILG